MRPSKSGNSGFSGLGNKAMAENGISRREALRILNVGAADLPFLFAEADMVRRANFGDTISLCSILNIKSGGCGEDCAFCAQSARYRTGVETYPLMAFKGIRKHAAMAKACGSHLGLISSGKRVQGGKGFERLLSGIRRLRNGPELHASLGSLDAESARRLKEAGITTYHHNIETAPSFFRKVIRTHTMEERLATIRNARAAGLKICCGGILGMGETPRQRVEMAFFIREIGPDRIPLNFLDPIPKTPLGHRPLMKPLDALKAVVMFRLVNPAGDIRICGGREKVLRELQPLIFFAGASGIMTGDYLTTQGRKPADDLRMIRDLGLKV